MRTRREILTLHEDEEPPLKNEENALVDVVNEEYV